MVDGIGLAWLGLNWNCVGIDQIALFGMSNQISEFHLHGLIVFIA
jgi:hypothetical protein